MIRFDGTIKVSKRLRVTKSRILMKGSCEAFILKWAQRRSAQFVSLSQSEGSKKLSYRKENFPRVGTFLKPLKWGEFKTLRKWSTGVGGVNVFQSPAIK